MTRPERRAQKRILPANARAWLVSGEFEDLYTTVNFARGLINISPRGACVETSGRLRPDLKLSVEVRFDDIQSSLRAEARAVWTDTVTEGGNETHRMGVCFVGTPQIPKPVRDLLSGARPEAVMAVREREFEDLKRKADERKKGPARKKAGWAKTLGLFVVLLVLIYAAGFWTAVLRGWLEPPGPGIRFRYAKENAELDRTLANVFRPAYDLFRAVGIPLTHVP